MSKASSSIVWIAAVAIFSYLGFLAVEKIQEPSAAPPVIPSRVAQVYLVLLAGENIPLEVSEEERIVIGCDDILIPVEMPVSSKRLKSVLHTLATYDADDTLKNPFMEQGMDVINVQKNDDGITIVNLSGEPKFGGLCDTPRFKAQIEEIVGLYADKYEIRLNGLESGWRCLGDGSGLCT